eukprot:COSAG01_NODE_20430_length_953_cov_58.937939_2_plen_184_part_00
MVPGQRRRVGGGQHASSAASRAQLQSGHKMTIPPPPRSRTSQFEAITMEIGPRSAGTQRGGQQPPPPQPQPHAQSKRGGKSQRPPPSQQQPPPPSSKPGKQRGAPGGTIVIGSTGAVLHKTLPRTLREQQQEQVKRLQTMAKKVRSGQRRWGGGDGGSLHVVSYVPCPAAQLTLVDVAYSTPC